MVWLMTDSETIKLLNKGETIVEKLNERWNLIVHLKLEEVRSGFSLHETENRKLSHT
jgi:hypothetical protein